LALRVAARRGRRGQASPLTVVILMAVTIAIGLAMFAFFTNVANQARMQQGATAAAFSVANSLQATIVLKESDESAAPAVYCYTLSISNMGGSDVRFGLTVLPAYRMGQNFYFDPLISIIPIHSATLPGNEDAGLNVRLFYLADIDGDGLVNLVGNAGVDLGEALPSCRETYVNTVYWGNAVDPTLYVDYANLKLVEGFSLSDMLENSGFAYYPKAPLWIETLPPGESVTLRIVIATYDFNNPTAIIPLTVANAVITAQVDQYHYIAVLLPLTD